MKRNYLALVCLLVAVICFCGCTRQVKQGNFVYKYDPMGATSVVKYTGSDAVVEIPAKYKDSSIMYIDTGAFQNLPNLQKVRLNTEEKVMIFDGAFVNCPNLSDVSAKGSISFSLYSSADKVFVNCPSMPIQTASTGNSSSSSNTSKNGVIGTYSRVSAKSTGGNTNSSSWKTVDDSRLGTGVNIPSKFVVNSNGTASAGPFSFTWSGSGSNITFTFSGSGNTKASYNASREEIYMQMPTIYNGKLDLLAITYR